MMRQVDVDAFHAHLDHCVRCRDQVFNLCPVGARLLCKVGGLENPNRPRLSLAEQRVESFDMPGCAVLETVLCPSALHDVEVGGTCAHGCGTPDECSDCPGALP